MLVGEKKSKEKWNNVLRSNELRANNENTRGERKIYVDGGALPSFSFSSVKLKFAQKHFMVSHKKNQEKVRGAQGNCNYGAG